jgi:hypothetical protein
MKASFFTDTKLCIQNVRVVSSNEKAQGKAPSHPIFSIKPPCNVSVATYLFLLQALWRKNQQEQLDFLAAARGPDIVAIEQDRSTSFVLDTSPQHQRSSRLHRPMKSLLALAPHPEAEAAAKIFSAGKSVCPYSIPLHPLHLCFRSSFRNSAAITHSPCDALTVRAGKHRDRNNRCPAKILFLGCSRPRVCKSFVGHCDV